MSTTPPVTTPPATPPAAPPATPPAAPPATPPATPPAAPPASYEIKTPDGVDPQIVNAYTGVAKDLNLDAGVAQKLIDTLGPKINEHNQAQMAAVHKEWADSLAKDKDIGGDKLPESMGHAAKALEEFGSPALREFAKVTQLEKHPEWVRAWKAVHDATHDAAFVGGRRSGGGKPADTSLKSIASRMYGKKK